MRGGPPILFYFQKLQYEGQELCQAGNDPPVPESIRRIRLSPDNVFTLQIFSAIGYYLHHTTKPIGWQNQAYHSRLLFPAGLILL